MRDRLSATIDARAFGAARILVAMAAIPTAVEMYAPLTRVLSGEFVTIPVIATPPPWVATPLFALALVAGFTMLFGVAARLSSAVVAGTSAAVLLIDQQLYSNHLLLLALMAALVALSECGRALTLRTYRAYRVTTPVPYWPALLMRVLISSVYLWTAFAKLTPDYLSGYVFDTFTNDWMPRGGAILVVAAVASIALEALVAVALWFRRLRFAAIGLGVVLHAGMITLLNDPAPLIPFAWLMFAGYCAFAWVPRPAGSATDASTTPRRPSSRRPARPAAPR